MTYFSRIRKNFKYGLIILTSFSLFLGCFSYAADDLLMQIMREPYERGMMFKNGEEARTVGKSVIEGSIVVDPTKGVVKNGPSMIVRITRLLLSITIALSVTMILYNGMIYIIQTGQGKDSKDLAKNIAFIVIGILVALFSVVFITLLQSVPKTLQKDLVNDSSADGIVDKGKVFIDLFNKYDDNA